MALLYIHGHFQIKEMEVFQPSQTISLIKKPKNSRTPNTDVKKLKIKFKQMHSVMQE